MLTPIRPARRAMTPGRLVPLGGTRNLRDLGGYATLDGRRTRWRTVFRSDCLDRLDAAGQTWLIEAGLRTVIDVRDDIEVAEHPTVFATSTQLAYRHMPLADESPPPWPRDQAPAIRDGYQLVLVGRARRLCAVVEAVLSPDAVPVLIHCAAGKDRTGIVVALLLAAVGVPAETIVEDYVLSSVCLGPAYVEERRQWVEERGLDWAEWQTVFDTPPERMLNTLDYLAHELGGVHAYLARYGIDGDRIRLLRELLTE